MTADGPQRLHSRHISGPTLPAYFAFLSLFVMGCGGGRSWFKPNGAANDQPRASADMPFSAASPADLPTEPAAAPKPPPVDILLRVTQVQVPREHRDIASKIWNNLQEGALDFDTQLRLRRNGIRVGVGRNEWWGDVRGTIDSVPDVRISQVDPVKIPPGYKLGLELDREPHEQTIFIMEKDGVLSGGTWPESRNALAAVWTPDPRVANRIQLAVVPEVRQKLSGWQWIRTEAGLIQSPKSGGQVFPTAGFTAPVELGQFLVIAPSEQADLFGLVGGAFLTETVDGQRYDTYVIVAPEFGDDSRNKR